MTTNKFSHTIIATKYPSLFSFLKLIDKYLFLGLLALLNRKYLLFKSTSELKKYEFNYSIFYSHRKSELDKLCDLYGSDKGYLDISNRIFFNNWHPHTYTDVYSSMFDHCKDNIKHVFECGIGTNTSLISGMGDQYKPGASLRVWRDYFKNAEILGVDIDKNILFTDDRIQSNYADQLNPATINEMWDKFNNIEFDLMIDDGLHTYEAGVTLFENSFHKLKTNGIYVIEDVSPLYLYRLCQFFRNYNLTIARLESTKASLLEDNNMIIIRK